MISEIEHVAKSENNANVRWEKNCTLYRKQKSLRKTRQKSKPLEKKSLIRSRKTKIKKKPLKNIDMLKLNILQCCVVGVDNITQLI